MTPTPELNKALAQARAEIDNPHLDGFNPDFKSKFSTLRSVINATVPTLTKHGIMVHQDLVAAEGGVECCTYLCHMSGEERLLGPLFIPCTKSNAQGYAAAATYARRIHLLAVLCIVGEDDDDANSISIENSAPISAEQAKVISDLLEELEVDKEVFLKHYQIESVEKMPASIHDRAHAALMRKRNRK